MCSKLLSMFWDFEMRNSIRKEIEKDNEVWYARFKLYERFFSFNSGLLPFGQTTLILISRLFIEGSIL